MELLSRVKRTIFASPAANDSPEALQFFDRTIDAGVTVDIELDNFRPCAVAPIAKFQTHLDRVPARHFVGRDLQVAESEVSIGESIPERILRCDVMLVEVAIPNVDPFRVLHMQVLTRIIPVGRRLLPIIDERERELARRIDVAK